MTPRTILRRATVTVAAAGIAVAAGLPAAQANSTFALTRVAGTDRYATASNLAAAAFGANTPNAVLARGDAFADALAGGYLAGRVGTGAPILLTTPGSLPQVTKDRLAAMTATTVYVLGGTGAVSAAVENELKAAGYTVDRVAGANKFATAAAIARKPGTAGIGTIDGKKTAILASGDTFADALAAGPLGYGGKFPILLVGRDSLPAETRSALTDLGIQHVVIAGGTGAVSTAVQNAVAVASKERVAGATRYETAAKLADFALAKIAGWNETRIDLATGESFADALAGGPAAGRTARAILLSAKDTLSGPTSDWLVKHATTLESGRALGGAGALTDETVTAGQNAGRGIPAGAAAGQLVRFNVTNKTYTYVPTGASASLTVTYSPSDTFTVDNQTATPAAFEGALSAGDNITHAPKAGTTPEKHDLTNVPATSFTTGTVGNVDIASKAFDIVNAVTGDALAVNRAWGDANLFKVDGATATQAGFQNNINEGDTVVVTGATYELTNVDLSGSADNITKASLPVGSTTFAIGALGDNPASGEDAAPPVANSDSRFSADGTPGATDKFVVDGNASAAWSDFNSALSVGDRITYGRKETGSPAAGVETYTLVNRAPTVVTGQAAVAINKDGNPATADDSDGGSFTLATSSGSQTVTYLSSGGFLIDGALSTEKEFEAAWTAGDTIAWIPADTPTNTSQRLELTNADLSGPVSAASINTTAAATPPPSSRPAKSYAVLASNGTTELATVVYSDGANPSANAYVVNGVPADLAAFEAALAAVKDGTKTGSVVVQKSSSAQTHRLTTA